MVAMRFDYRDIFRSARLAFSFQRLWIQFFGLGTGYIIYLVLTYLSMMFGRQKHTFAFLWEKFNILSLKQVMIT